MFPLLVAEDHSSNFTLGPREEHRAVLIGTLGDRWAPICLFWPFFPPSMAHPITECYNLIRIFLPLSFLQPCSLLTLTHKWSSFLRVLSIIPLNIYFLASPYLKLLLQKQLLRSQGLFTGKHEYVKPSRCLLLLLLSRGVSQQFCLWLALYQDIR